MSLCNYSTIISALSRNFEVRFYRPQLDKVWIVTIDDELSVVFKHSVEACIWDVLIKHNPIETEVKLDMQSALRNLLLNPKLEERKLLETFKCIVEVCKGKHYETSGVDHSVPKKCDDAIGACSRVKQALNIKIAAVFTKPLKDVSLSSSRAPHTNEQESGKKPPMKTAMDVINRITWDSSLDPSLFAVAYEDRFDGIIEKQFSEFDWDKDIAGAGLDDFCIPQHRIQYFKYGNRVVWDKRSRLDNIFGSTFCRTTIRDVMEQEQNTFYLSESDDSQTSAAPTQSLCKLTDYIFQEECQRPNFFIAACIDSPDVRKSVAAYQRKLLGCAEEENIKEYLTPAMVSVEKLHITLCVCCIRTLEELATTKQILEETFQSFMALDVNFDGVGQFNQYVTYAKVICPRMEQSAEQLAKKLKESGIDMQGNYDEFVPHMTLVKRNRRAPLCEPMQRILENDNYRKWNFKGQSVTKIALCEMRSTAENGFYSLYALCELIPDVNKAVQPLKDRRTQDRIIKKQRKSKPKKRRPRGDDNVDDARVNGKESSKYDVKLGKHLVSVLRHNKYGFTVDAGGYLPLDRILQHQLFSRKLNATRADIYRVVENNDKQRFRVDIIDGTEMIKANQGHTVQVRDLNLKEIHDPDEYPVVVHGTFWPAWEQICRQGLHRRKRNHIHMTSAIPSDRLKPISGMRTDCKVFIYINLCLALADGIPFYLSSNGVILSPGDENGFLRTKYFKKVEGITKKQRILLFDGSPNVVQASDASSQNELPSDSSDVTESGKDQAEPLGETTDKAEPTSEVDTNQTSSANPSQAGSDFVDEAQEGSEDNASQIKEECELYTDAKSVSPQEVDDVEQPVHVSDLVDSTTTLIISDEV